MKLSDDTVRTKDEIDHALAYCLAMLMVEMRSEHEQCATIAARCCDLLEWVLKRDTPGAEKFGEVMNNWLGEIAEMN